MIHPGFVIDKESRTGVECSQDGTDMHFQLYHIWFVVKICLIKKNLLISCSERTNTNLERAIWVWCWIGILSDRWEYRPLVGQSGTVISQFSKFWPFLRSLVLNRILFHTIYVIDIQNVCIIKFEFLKWLR